MHVHNLRTSAASGSSACALHIRCLVQETEARSTLHPTVRTLARALVLHRGQIRIRTLEAAQAAARIALLDPATRHQAVTEIVAVASELERQAGTMATGATRELLEIANELMSIDRASQPIDRSATLIDRRGVAA